MSEYEIALINYIRNSDNPDAAMDQIEELLNLNQYQEESRMLSAPPVS
jgi:hypothetical protein